MCKCGQETISSRHKVTTLKKAVEWVDFTTQKDLPLEIDQNKCPGCGRINYKVYSSAGKTIKTFN